MKPSEDAYTVAMPWYEREDFYELLALAEDRDEGFYDYDEWHRKAAAVAKSYLARGNALSIVTIKPKAYAAWLAEKQLPNVAATRLRYIEELAAAGTATEPITAPGVIGPRA